MRIDGFVHAHAAQAAQARAAHEVQQDGFRLVISCVGDQQRPPVVLLHDGCQSAIASGSSGGLDGATAALGGDVHSHAGSCNTHALGEINGVLGRIRGVGTKTVVDVRRKQVQIGLEHMQRVQQARGVLPT